VNRLPLVLRRPPPALLPTLPALLPTLPARLPTLPALPLDRILRIKNQGICHRRSSPINGERFFLFCEIQELSGRAMSSLPRFMFMFLL
jgi:hypothetical protein